MALTNLFERNFKRNLQREKLRILKEAKVLKEDALEGALDTEDLGDNQGISDALGDLETKAKENKEQEVKLQKYIDKHNAQTNDIIIEWIKKLDDFASFVNDPTNESSIKSILDSALPGSVLEKAGKAEYRQLTKVAQALSGLSQSLRAYVVGMKAQEEAASQAEADAEASEAPEEVAEPEEAPEEAPAEPVAQEEEEFADEGVVGEDL